LVQPALPAQPEQLVPPVLLVWLALPVQPALPEQRVLRVLLV
jgi:hypothetical protein